MRLIDADALYRKVKTECNPYGKPTIGFEDGIRVMNWIEQSPTVDEWISVNDKLPPAAETVLFTGTNLVGERFRAQTGYYNLEVWVAENIGIVNATFTVTHWMPLPELPKENS